MVFALVLLLAGTACKTPHHMNDTKSLQGTWTCVSAIVDGKPLPPATVQLLRLTLTADRYKTEKGSDVLFDSTYRINTLKKPHEIEMVGTEGDLAGKEAQGIFAFDGDRLHMCYTMPGNPRPTAFESEPGSKAYLVIWKK
jgi:uncharacterized protein (TIGR03067 family)